MGENSCCREKSQIYIPELWESKSSTFLDYALKQKMAVISNFGDSEHRFYYTEYL